MNLTFLLFFSLIANDMEELSIKQLKDIPWPDHTHERMDHPLDRSVLSQALDGAIIDDLCFEGGSAYDKNGDRLFSLCVNTAPSAELLFASRMDRRISDFIEQVDSSQAKIIKHGESITILDPIHISGTNSSEYELTEYFSGKYSIKIAAYGERRLGPYGGHTFFTPIWPYTIPKPSIEEMEKICRQVILILNNKNDVRRDFKETTRRKDLFKKRYKEYREEREQHLPMRATQEWNKRQEQEPRQFTRIFWDNANYGKGIEELLKLEPLPERNTIPNINMGIGCQPFLEQLIQKGFKLMARKGGDYLMTATLKDKKTSIRYCIYHAFNPTDARQTLFAWNMYADESGTPRIVEKPGDFTMQAAIDNMNVRPGLLGDFDISTRPRFNWEGSLVEGSEKSAVYFMRGNTAAYFIADNPSYDVLPLARMLDELLKKGLEQTSDTPEKTPSKTD